MNILLTEIRSLTLDLSGLPEVGADTAASFARLLQQQLPANPGEGEQVIDYSSIYSEFEQALAALETAPEVVPASAWREFLAQDALRISSDEAALETTPVSLVPGLGDEVPLAANAAAVSLPPGGEALPRGGNSLPESAAILPAPAVAGGALPAVDLDPAFTQARPAAAAEDISLGAPQTRNANADIASTPSRTTPPSLSPQPAAQAAAAAPALSASIPLAELDAARPLAQPAPAAQVAGDGRSGEAIPLADLRAFAASVAPQRERTATAPRSAIQAESPRPANPAAAASALAATLPVAEMAGRVPIPAGSAEPAAPVYPQPPAAGNSEALAERVGPVAERITDPLKSVVENPPSKPLSIGADAAAQAEARESMRLQLSNTQPLNTQPPADAAAPQTQSLRGTDAIAAASSQATPAPAPAAAPVTLAPPVTHSTLQPGDTLPPQLEVLQMSRQGDGAESGNGLGERVQWMINQKQNSAMIRLDPPALGKLDVQVKVAEDSTTITIQTQHAQTRELIETASHRLRDFLQESGYQNVNVDVSQRQDQQQARAQASAVPGDDSGRETDAEAPADGAEQFTGNGYLQGDGLLDTFA